MIITNKILLLIFAHLIGDYVLQNDFIANTKGSNWFIMVVHSALWTGCIIIAMNICGMGTDIIDVFFLMGLHATTDQSKCEMSDKSKSLTTYLYFDQIAHMVQIFTLVWIKGGL